MAGLTPHQLWAAAMHAAERGADQQLHALLCSATSSTAALVRLGPAQGSANTTLLYTCARYGCLQCVRLLLSRFKADPAQPGMSRSTPLHGAAWGGHEDIVRLLLEDPRTPVGAENSYGETALDNARGRKADVIVRLLQGFAGPPPMPGTALAAGNPAAPPPMGLTVAAAAVAATAPAAAAGAASGPAVTAPAAIASGGHHAAAVPPAPNIGFNMRRPAQALPAKVGSAAVPVERLLHGCPNKAAATRRLRLVCISDTHVRWNNLDRLRLPPGDVLVHCGDFTNEGKEAEWASLVAFMRDAAAQFKHRIVICGNHDYTDRSPGEIQALLGDAAVYLQDSAVVLGGVKIYGSPWTNINMAFHADEAQQERVFARVPEDTDVLLTHQPPFNVLDKAWVRTRDARRCFWCGEVHEAYQHWGSQALRRRVAEVNPAVHVFGHVHDEKGLATLDGGAAATTAAATGAAEGCTTLFVNAAMDLAPKPIVVHLYSNDGDGCAASGDKGAVTSAGAVAGAVSKEANND